jgi:hypothetical protein
MAIDIITSFDSKSREVLDRRSGPYASVAEALAALNTYSRPMGMPIYVIEDGTQDAAGNFITGTVQTYSFTGDITDANLVLKEDNKDNQIETVGESVLTGDVLYLKDDSKYYKSSNLDVVKSKGILLIATEDITTDSLGKLSKTGVHTDVLTEEFDIGSLVFLGANGDYISELEAISLLPTNVMRVIGQINSSGKLDFTPGESFIEVI